MLKTIVQASVGTASRSHGIATFLKKSTWTSGRHIHSAGTSGIHRRHGDPGRSQTQLNSLPLGLSDSASNGHPSSSNPKPLASSQVSTAPSLHPKVSPSSQVSADSLGVSLSRLCLSPEEAAATVQYQLPSMSSITQDAILDPVANMAIPLDLPTSIYRDFIDVPSTYGGSVDSVIGDPETPSSTITKRASNIIQKRHRKMKRHQYKKWRKRNRFRLRIRKQRRRKKQRERWQRHLNQFRFTELSAAEREAHLEKKRERLHIFLRYLGVPVDDIIREKEGAVEEDVSKKKKKEVSWVIAPGGTGKITPVPILPKGVIPK